MVTSESNMRTDGYDNARSESSHHCPNSRQGAVANHVEIECIGTPHTTVSQQAEQVTTSHRRCNDIEIERIGTPHMTVRQQAEQVRVVTGQQSDAEGRPKEESLQMKRKPNQITYRITNESQYQVGDRSFTATQPRWQSTINMMEKSSTEKRIFKRGREPCLHDQVLPSSQKPTWRQSTETRTDKSTKKSTVMSTKKSTKILLKLPTESASMKSTRWSPKRTSKDDY
jgi:hypothetical protein